MAPQLAKKLTTINAALDPLGPNRIEAHNKKGSGRYNNAGVVFCPPFKVTKLKFATISKPAVRAVASRYRRGAALSSERMPPLFHVTMAGTNVSDASTFEKKRIRNTSQ